MKTGIPARDMIMAVPLVAKPYHQEATDDVSKAMTVIKEAIMMVVLITVIAFSISSQRLFNISSLRSMVF